MSGENAWLGRTTPAKRGEEAFSNSDIEKLILTKVGDNALPIAGLHRIVRRECPSQFSEAFKDIENFRSAILGKMVNEGLLDSAAYWRGVAMRPFGHYGLPPGEVARRKETSQDNYG